MLKQLIDYARATKLEARPGFAEDYIRWLLIFDENGKFLNVVGRTNDSKAKGDLFLCPKLSQPLLKAGGTGTRHFLVDTIAVIALYGLEKIEEPEQVKLSAKHSFFVSLLLEASEQYRPLAPIATSLSDSEKIIAIREALERQSPAAKPTQNASFAVNTKDGLQLIFTDDGWHDWYESFLQRLRDAKAAKKKRASENSMRSLASGQSVVPAQTHPKLAGLSDIGGNASVALASFNQPAFAHFGLSQSENAAVSIEEAATYTSAANDLIRKSRPLAMGKVAYWFIGGVERLPSDADIVAEDVFGTDAVAETEEADDLAEVENNHEAEKQEAAVAVSHARKLLDAIENGERPELEAFRFNALSIGANASRLVIRDFMEGTFIDLLRSVCAWIDDLAITKLDVAKAANHPKLQRVITAPLPPKSPSQKYKDWIKPVTKLREPLWRAAVGHQSLAKTDSNKQRVPIAAVEMLLVTLRAAVLNGEIEDANKGGIAARSRLYTRMGLLKMFLLRNHGDLDVKTNLNEEHPSAAYQCGRLLAVLANVQQQALGDVGANVVQRFYARASTAPADAIGPIIRLSNAHLNKLDTGLAVLLRDKIANILGRIEPKEEDPLPKSLDAQGQSLFALGYYQQIARDRQDMLVNVAKKKQKDQQSQ